jgi:galactokinase/mevalonate kinase-like predicted kinase
LGTPNEKPHKNDEAQYDVDQEKYDYSVGSILEQLKQKVVELFGTMQQKISEIVENVQKKVGKTKESFGSIVDEIKQKASKL